MHTELAILVVAAALASPASAQTTPAPPPAPAPPTYVAPPMSAFPMRPVAPLLNRGPYIPITETLFANSRYYVSQYQHVQQFGRCAAHISARQSRALLDSAPNTPTERERVGRVAAMSRACQSYGFAAPVVFLRAGLAEALYKMQPESATLHVSGTTSAELASFGSAETARSKARLVDDRLFTNVANCYALAAPRQVRTLLYSTHGTAEERDAMTGVIAAAPSCATGKTLTASGGTSFLRAYIAESAYRWATVNGASGD